MENSFCIKGRVVDVVARQIMAAEVLVKDGIIEAINPCEDVVSLSYLLPGLIDAHVHVESSLLIPSEFARLAVVHGMVATVSDPHEIANVCGMEGVYFMLDNAGKTPFKFYFGAPSCVPATLFETAGAYLGAREVEQLLGDKRIVYLAEMMNFPGVLQGDKEVMEKIAIAHRLKKPVDGHAPGLMGEQAKAYAAAGISTDHECFTLEEALDKIEVGMKIQIREGSAARNFEALHPLLSSHPEKVMFCSDDKHPDSLLEGHINQHVKRALDLGYDLFDVLRASSFNIREHYSLNTGMLQVGDPADFIRVNNLKDFQILNTWIDGVMVADNGQSLLHSIESEAINHFNSCHVDASQLKVQSGGKCQIKVIGALEGQLITEKRIAQMPVLNGEIQSDIQQDVLKIVVVNRYVDVIPAVAFIQGMGIKKGAFGATVAHDSHNIVTVGVDDQSIARCIQLLMQSQGGLCALNGDKELLLPLPVAGLMTNMDAYQTAANYIQLDQFVKNELGSNLRAPFMTLSFMALLVIPHLKLSDIGLFDGDSFCFTSNFV
ncbi:MAG: adenine deaminase [Flavobacteriales bacterium]